MGMAHQDDNAFCCGRGQRSRGSLRFKRPHIPGGDDHSDGEVSRYPELTFIACLTFPRTCNWLATNCAMLIRVQGRSRRRCVHGSASQNLIPDNEPLALFNEMGDVEHRVLCQASTYLQGWW